MVGIEWWKKKVHDSERTKTKVVNIANKKSNRKPIRLKLKVKKNNETENKYVESIELTISDLQNISASIVLIRPAEAVQNLQDLFMLQHAEKTVEKDLEADRSCLSPVQHQTGDVEDDVRLHHLDLHAEIESVLVSKFVKGCNTQNQRWYPS